MVKGQKSERGYKQPGKRAAAWLAWSCWTLTAGLIVVTLFLKHLNSSLTLLGDTFGVLVPFAFATVGLLIASRRPENLIGWVIAFGTLLMTASGFMLEYSDYGLLTAPGSLPISLWVAMFGGWFRSIGFILMVYVVLLLFPDGHLPSPRWRKVAWLLVTSGLVQGADAFFSPDFSDIDSSLSSFSKPTGDIFPQPVPQIFGGLTVLLWVASVFACVAAIVVRFRRSRGDERQQLKWLTYSALLSGAILVLIYASVLLNLDIGNTIGGYLFDAALAPIPIAVGIAVLKYRLYDIDIIVNRTLVYGALTSILALVYFGSVVLLEALLRPVTGQGGDLAIVGSTLMVAALFVPLRRRIQATIDRRFYRRKYDAAKTLAAFSATLRDEVDLNSLAARLVEVVEETMQPTQVSLWLSKPGRKVASNE